MIVVNIKIIKFYSKFIQQHHLSILYENDIHSKKRSTFFLITFIQSLYMKDMEGFILYPTHPKLFLCTCISTVKVARRTPSVVYHLLVSTIHTNLHTNPGLSPLPVIFLFFVLLLSPGTAMWYSG